MSRSESRQGFSPAGKIFGLLFVAGILIACGWWWWACRHDSSVPFLPTSASAEWIVYPKSPDTSPHRATPLTAVFRRTWTLTTLPASATLSARAFRQGRIVINGHVLDEIHLNEQDWKKIRSADVVKYLHSGENEISVTVTNLLGPPALWLALESGATPIRSDGSWLVSYAGAAWQKAQLASLPPAIRPGSNLFGRELVAQSMGRTWQTELIILLVSCALVALFVWQQSKITAAASTGRTKWLRWENLPVFVLALILISWAVLFWNNLPLIAPILGFDRDGHLLYVDYILKKGTLPLADEGWQMYQPPLFYVLSAVIVASTGGSASSDSAVLALRVFSMFTGMALVVAVFLCLRLLFPKQPARQIIGLLIAGYLPANLCLSHNITNEILSALLVTLALYFTLQTLRSVKVSIGLLIAVGASLGLAMLAKFSAVLAVPFIFVALGWPRAGENQPRSALRSIGIAFVTFAIVCGWHFARVWHRFGTPLIGNWDPRLSFAWWQDPGYHTAGWYAMFGDTLICPLFSSITSFGDGVYSTLWGDGLCSGSATMSFRPQWNYDLMNWAYILALPATLLIAIGAIVSVARFLRRPTPEYFLLLGLGFAFVAGIALMSLRVPSYAQVKAFYGLSALLPLCVMAVAGWNFLASLIPKLRILFWVWLLVWVMTVLGAFWIRAGKPFTYTVRGVGFSSDGRFADAAREYSRALELDPNSLKARAGLADALNDLGQKADALDQIASILKQHPQSGEALIQSAIILGINGADEKAIAQFHEGLIAQPDDPVAYRQLAGSLARTHRYNDMRKACEDGLRVDPFNADLHRLLAGALGKLDDPTNGVAQLRIALQLRPNWALAQSSLALMLASAGDLDESVKQYEEAIKAKPDDPNLRRQFAVTLMMQGNARAAVEQFYLVLTSQPDNIEVLNNLAWILAVNANDSVRNGTEAVRLAEHACELTQRQQPVLLGTLAAAYAETGRFNDAIAAAEEARTLATASAQPDVAARNTQLLDLYRAGKPFREPAPATR